MKIKYFLRGLGVGILVTALLLFAGSAKAKKPAMSDEEVIDRAKQLGMLTQEEASDYRLDKNLDVIKESLGESASPQPETTTFPADDSTTAPVQTKAEVTGTPSVSPSAEQTQKPKKKPKKKEQTKKTITLAIKSGMTTQAVSRYLYQNNVIRNEEDFVTYMMDHNLTAKLQVGKYEIPIDATHAEIATIITKK